MLLKGNYWLISLIPEIVAKRGKIDVNQPHPSLLGEIVKEEYPKINVGVSRGYPAVVAFVFGQNGTKV